MNAFADLRHLPDPSPDDKFKRGDYVMRSDDRADLGRVLCVDGDFVWARFEDGPRTMRTKDLRIAW